MAPKKPSWAIDPLEGAVGKDAAGALRTAGRYIGGGLQDFLGSQAVRESPFGAAGSLFAPRKAYAIGTERQGPYLPDRLQRAPQAPVLPAPITSPNTTFQNADEEYKTLLSQYGGTSGVQQLAGMQSLPTGFTPTGGKQAAGLEDYYSAQRAVGAKNIGEITGALGYQKGSPMEQWAKANPMLAMREYNEKFPAGAPTQGPSDEAIRAAMGGGTYFPSEGSPSPVANAPSLAGQTSFGNIANPVAPATALNQGAAMDANRGKENLVPQQAAKTTPDGAMPNLPTTLDKVSGFLNGLTPVIKAVFPAGAGQIFGPRY